MLSSGEVKEGVTAAWQLHRKGRARARPLFAILIFHLPLNPPLGDFAPPVPPGSEGGWVCWRSLRPILSASIRLLGVTG
jgi:hypothetical protein